jgi:hypothetical protein
MSIFWGDATVIEDAVVGFEDPFEPVVADELFYSSSMMWTRVRRPGG